MLKCVSSESPERPGRLLLSAHLSVASLGHIFRVHLLRCRIAWCPGHHVVLEPRFTYCNRHPSLLRGAETLGPRVLEAILWSPSNATNFVANRSLRMSSSSSPFSFLERILEELRRSFGGSFRMIRNHFKIFSNL